MRTFFLRFILAGILLICCVHSVPTFADAWEARHVVDVYVASKVQEYRRLEQATKDNFEDGHYASALAFADEALALEKKLPQIRIGPLELEALICLKANCLAKLGFINDAFKMLETRALNGWCAPEGLSLAITLRIQRKEFDKALADYEVIKTQDDDREGKYAMQQSEIYLAMGDRTKALEALQNAYDKCIKNDIETSTVRKKFYDLDSKPGSN
jgi:tetratricopeptide (TPR) repeat protein